MFALSKYLGYLECSRWQERTSRQQPASRWTTIILKCGSTDHSGWPTYSMANTSVHCVYTDLRLPWMLQGLWLSTPQNQSLDKEKGKEKGQINACHIGDTGERQSFGRFVMPDATCKI